MFADAHGDGTPFFMLYYNSRQGLSLQEQIALLGDVLYIIFSPWQGRECLLTLLATISAHHKIKNLSTINLKRSNPPNLSLFLTEGSGDFCNFLCTFDLHKTTYLCKWAACERKKEKKETLLALLFQMFINNTNKKCNNSMIIWNLLPFILSL